MRRPRGVALLAGACVVGLLLIPLGAAAVAKKPNGKGHPVKSAGHGNGNGKGAKVNGNGRGKGRQKVTLCHKGRTTITVGAPAVMAHLRHGDAHGACGAPTAAPQPGTATLTVIKHVVSALGGTKSAGDFTITINGVNAAGDNSFAGSESGVTKTITTFGSYSVTEGEVPGYVLVTTEGDCAGTIAPGDSKTCILTNADNAALLTVTKHVVNDNGGTKSAADFTLTINGVNASGSNSFPGSESGVTKVITTVGAYSVTETILPGYLLVDAQGNCSGTIAFGEHRICTLVNDDQPS